MMEHSLYCPDCDTTGPHMVEGREATCRSCWTIRTVYDDVLAAVMDVERCPHCRVTHPVGGECVTDLTPCLRKTGLWPCGTCDVCLAAQERDLARRADLIEYGSPSDLDTP
ncbi:hypothetical protein FH608_046525 [Nonomuraea phyllanthi]|uniref:Uncharacterized protein n=1 Tax=Nonomuraea phyllanthi TaxID=2219224 RepID=A0A5C4V628_9ACTN|nr:hypothetical protein [Nonomuraea phyllanthi]KAB8186949.1 hypothetical protein FH608_046525 [Nonomuraea phyllanthi]